MGQLRCVFDVVRLVDPEKMQVLDDGAGGSTRGCNYPQCYAIFGREGRCKNCISMNVLNTKGRAAKLEFVDESVYAIFAKYVQLDGHDLVLEMVYSIREELLLEAYGRTTFLQYVNNYNQQFYQDVLTGADNQAEQSRFPAPCRGQEADTERTRCHEFKRTLCLLRRRL